MVLILILFMMILMMMMMMIYFVSNQSLVRFMKQFEPRIELYHQAPGGIENHSLETNMKKRDHLRLVCE